MATNNMINSSFLWFEFLINRELLEEHLNQVEPEPSASVLLVQFVENAEKYSGVGTINGAPKVAAAAVPPPPFPMVDDLVELESEARITKVKTFKSMALQMAAYLNWDLEILALLPFTVQHSLMKYASEFSESNKFICSVYHRWVLRSCRTPVLRKPNQQDAQAEALLKSLNPDLSLEQLSALLVKDEGVAEQPDVIAPTQSTFSSNIPEFSTGNKIPFSTFRSMLHLDMGIYLLFKGNSAAAVTHFKQSQGGLPENYLYLKMTKEKINAYYMAVGILATEPDSPEDTSELRAVSFARLLRQGAIGELRELVGDDGGGSWEPTGPGGGKEQSRGLQLDKRDKQREGNSVFELEGRLLETSDLNSIKEILLKLHAMTSTSVPGPASGGVSQIISSRSFWKIFSNIEIPIPIQHSLNKFPPGAFQDYVFILVAKSRQFLKMKRFQESLRALQLAIFDLNEHLLSVPPQSANTPYFFNISKLIKLLDWELILIDLSDLFENWPAMTSTPSCKQFIIDLNQRCKEIIHTSFHLANSSGGGPDQTSVLTPRSEILETIVMGLLNLGEYAFIVEQGLTKWTFLEFLTLLAKVCMDLVERKDSSTNYRELFYGVLPTFSNTTSATSKRQGGGGGGSSSGSGATKGGAANVISNRSVFMWVIERSHSHLLVSLFVSLLARFHNHIQDDVTLQIHSADFLHIWPNILDEVTTSADNLKLRVSGSSKLNPSQIFDVLLALLHRNQHNEGIWLKCIGDVYLASGNPAQAMKAYLEYLALTTDFFEKHSSTNWADNGLFRRMIKCCELLQAFTQAVILCQFLTEVDYSLAFGMAQEKLTTDSSDALYGFIWDLAILEFLVNLHTKRNELGKRQQAVKIMGLLELNGNNNEEIQREAMHLRKSQFMRTLAKLYIFV